MFVCVQSTVFSMKQGLKRLTMSNTSLLTCYFVKYYLRHITNCMHLHETIPYNLQSDIIRKTQYYKN